MKVIYIILFIYSGACYSQTKKEYIVDENNNSISDTLFLEKLKEIDNNKMKYYYKFFENDTAKIGQVLLFRTTGKIDIETKESITYHINKSTGKNISNNQILVINYYNDTIKKGSCMKFQLNNKEYLQYFKNNESAAEVSFATKKSMKNIRNLYEDVDNIIGDKLFQEYMLCGNYIIIWPDGRYIKELGEHHPKDIINDLNSGF